MNNTSRRNFLKNNALLASGTILAPTIIPACSRGKNGHTAPSDRITLAAVGVRGRGNTNLTGLLKQKGVQVVVACDLDTHFLTKMQNAIWSIYENKDCRAYTDYRELLEKESVDTAVISVPDHWHMLLYNAFANKKIDIYGEKPLVRKIEEGKKLVKTIEDNDIVFQTGSQQRSMKHFRHACELVANGVLGKIERIEVGIPNMTKEIGIPPIQEPPKEIDYNFWVGPAEYLEYRGVLHGHWRWLRNYSGGQLTDWVGHHMDIALWSMEANNAEPVEITGDATFRENTIFDVPYSFDIQMNMSNEVPVRLCSESFTPHKHGVCWYGENGWLYASRKEGLKASNENILKEVIPENGIHLYESGNHYKNFIDCVKSREKTVAPVDAGFRSITAGLLGEIAYLTGETIHWNPIKQELVNASPEALALSTREYREPWVF
ncbi:Gfo/Idh/MocA family oxidoreductase [uncultured Draconibacterium sp.]|uniref:Gfo/Idh/MocA family protein n=1 Tax=uncultured Draconibacterium sp. TaxID=1573823 RepID=UPI0029C0E702|nr:Gfo/Idh/MocA family oxidoreductase [uncultured Draconibacterium sp.]